MDIKSKNIRYTSALKALAAFACVAGLLAAAWGLTRAGNFPLAVQSRSYRDSEEYAQKVSSVYSRVYTALFHYRSEAAILAGDFLEEDYSYGADRERLQSESDSAVSSLEENYRSSMESAAVEGDTVRWDMLQTELAAKVSAEREGLDAALAKAKADAVERERAEYRAAKQYLDELEARYSMYYHAADEEGAVLASVNGADASALAARPGNVALHENPNNRSMRIGVPQGCTVHIGMLPDAYAQAAADYAERRNDGVAGLLWAGCGALAFLLGMAWLLYAAGRRPQADGVTVGAADAVYLDVGFVIAGIIVGFCAAGLVFLYNMAANYTFDPAAVYVLGGLLVACVAVTAMLYLVSAAKRAKRGELLKHTAVYRVLSWLVRTVRTAMNGGPLALKAALLFGGYAVASALAAVLFAVTAFHSYAAPAALFFFLVLLALNGAALFYVLKKAAAMKGMMDGVGRIRAGDLSHRIPAAGGAPFASLAESLNSISEGLAAAVEDRVRAERMKAELVTNVSHDLKTPLTSILTYVDLIKAEGLASENAPGYLSVLDAKARRLKVLTEDLFEAAKAASGSIQPNLAQLDVCELMSQGLGELEDKIGDSGLDFRISLPAEPLHVAADGRLLWRVMENLFSNVFKYALPGSRVYVGACREGDWVCVTVKNISADELNMPPETLTERFTRGDASRSSEGSGLGLSIANNLTELQGGSFRIDIDGDLFKATVALPSAPPPPAHTSAPA